MGETMLATAGKSRGAGFIAYDPAQEDAHTLSLLDAIVEGSGFRTAHDKGIILGERLARNLGVGMGKKVVYTVTDRHGEIVSALARVSGILRTGAPTADGALCLLPLDTVRTTLGYAPGEATQVAVFVADERFSDRVAANLGRRVAPDVAALPWYETQPELATFIAMKVGGMRVMEVFIALLVAAGIFNTIFVSVTERMREFGIMLAIGFSPADLFKLVMAESVWYGLLGLVGAAAITAWPYYYLSQTGIDVTGLYGSSSEVAGIVLPAVMRVGIYGENLLLIAVSVLLATLLAGLYPAWKAGRVEPVETIKLV